MGCLIRLLRSSTCMKLMIRDIVYTGRYSYSIYNPNEEIPYYTIYVIRTFIISIFIHTLLSTSKKYMHARHKYSHSP
jgi:hypothetical protein